MKTQGAKEVQRGVPKSLLKRDLEVWIEMQWIWI